MLVLMGYMFARQPLTAQELLIPAAIDNTLYSESDSSNGKGNYLFTGLTAVGNERRALIKFDLSQIKTFDSVTSATLRLYLSKTTSGDFSIGLYRMKRNWGEGTSDARFEEGGGATPKPGDATWNYAFYDTTRWSVNGGDHEEVASASGMVGDTIGTYDWTGDTMRADIRKWINEPDSNFGWVLIIKEQETPTSKRFNSRENSEFPPQLIVNVSKPSSVIHSKEIDYRIFPNPSSGVLFVNGNDLDMRKIRMFDLTGREISGNVLLIRRISNSLITITVLLKGTYILQLDQSFHKIVVAP